MKSEKQILNFGKKIINYLKKVNMKKILSILFGASLLLATSAQAEGMIGIKYGTGELDATKKAYTAGDTDYASASKAGVPGVPTDLPPTTASKNFNGLPSIS